MIHEEHCYKKTAASVTLGWETGGCNGSPGSAELPRWDSVSVASWNWKPA